MEISIFGFEGMTQVFSYTQPLSGMSIAVFEDIPLPAEQFIFATADYDDLVYGSDIAVIEAGTTSVDLVIPYYEQTSDPSVLKAERLHIFYGFESEETLQVYVLYIFSNISEQVLTAENPNDPALSFTLPEGALNLQHDIDPNLQSLELANGFGIHVVYPQPEPYQILYSFELPYSQNETDFELPIGIDTNAVIVMLPENGVELESDLLVDAGMRDIEGVSYNLYNGSSMQAGDLLNMAVSGWPKGAPETSETGGVDTSSGLVIGLGAFGLMLIAAGVYLWQRNRRDGSDRDGDHDELESDPVLESPEAIMDAIIALDELHKAGEIPEGAYTERRMELKERLRELLER
jgi:hypothetical protein